MKSQPVVFKAILPEDILELHIDKEKLNLSPLQDILNINFQLTDPDLQINHFLLQTQLACQNQP